MKRLDIKPETLSLLSQYWILFIVLIIAIVIITTLFYAFLYFFKSRTKNIFKNMSNSTSEIKVDIKDKLVNIKTKGFENSEKVYDLDYFIYTTSLNKGSKTFREMLKLINNDAEAIEIKNKANTVPSVIPFIMEDGKGKKSIVAARIEKNSDFEDFTTIQISETFIDSRKKQRFLNFLEDDLEQYNSKELFSAITKEVKNIKTKGWTLVELKYSGKFVETDKGYSEMFIQLLYIKKILLNMKYTTFLGTNGSLYILSQAGKNSNHFVIQKEWKNKINTLIPSKNPINLNSKTFKTTTVNMTTKDSATINIAFIKLGLLQQPPSKTETKEEWISYIDKKAKEINRDGQILVKDIKNKKNIIRGVEHPTLTKGVRPIIEYYYDINPEKIDSLMKYSFKLRNVLLEKILIHANLESKKHPNQISTVIISTTELDIIVDVLKNIKPKPNFYISFVNNDDDKNSTQWRGVFEEIRNSGHKVIQFITNINDRTFKMLRASMPTIIVIKRTSNNINDQDQFYKIHLKNLKNIKLKKTKLIELA